MHTSAEAAGAEAGGQHRRDILVVKDLAKHYAGPKTAFGRRSGAVVRALDGVSFSVAEGETLGVVGESGCGKSTLARCILRLVQPTSGSVNFLGQDIVQLSSAEMRRVRRDLMIVFQDPYSSLNPRMRVGAILAEALQIHGIGGPAERKARVDELLDIVGLNREYRDRYPHEFSGGQRQRIGIARALAVEPKLIVCDEPVSALDVSVQAQVLNLLKDLQKELGLTYIFIAHDLDVVRHISDRTMVMYLGKAVEIARTEELYARPRHPYTDALLASAPVPDPVAGAAAERTILEGDVPSPSAPPPGCTFHPRCVRAQPGRCDVDAPALREVSPGRIAACHFPVDL